MNQANTTFDERELAILTELVGRTHTNNAMSGKGNSREMTALFRKLNALTGNEEANDD